MRTRKVEDGRARRAFPAGASRDLRRLRRRAPADRTGTGDILAGAVFAGGNAFEVLFPAAGDFAYLEGSIFGEFTSRNVFTAVAVIVMTGVLILGMLHRERHGLARIIGLYVMSAVVLFA